MKKYPFLFWAGMLALALVAAVCAASWFGILPVFNQPSQTIPTRFVTGSSFR